jgi:hypothetical protein
MGCKLALVKDLQLMILKMPPTIKVTISKNGGTANGRTTNELDETHNWGGWNSMQGAGANRAVKAGATRF